MPDEADETAREFDDETLAVAGDEQGNPAQAPVDLESLTPEEHEAAREEHPEFFPPNPTPDVQPEMPVLGASERQGDVAPVEADVRPEAPEDAQEGDWGPWMPVAPQEAGPAAPQPPPADKAAPLPSPDAPEQPKSAEDRSIEREFVRQQDKEQRARAREDKRVSSALKHPGSPSARRRLNRTRAATPPADARRAVGQQAWQEPAVDIFPGGGWGVAGGLLDQGRNDNRAIEQRLARIEQRLDEILRKVGFAK